MSARPRARDPPALFQLYALLKMHLAEEDAYLRIIDHGVPGDVGELLAAAMEHPVALV